MQELKNAEVKLKDWLQKKNLIEEKDTIQIKKVGITYFAFKNNNKLCSGKLDWKNQMFFGLNFNLEDKTPTIGDFIKNKRISIFR